jgi:hypothetical protein
MTTTSLATAEAHFRLYETTLAQIISRYPAPSEISFSGAGQSTVRINLKAALENYLLHPSIASTIPRDLASLALREFVFSNAPGGKVYIGPRRPSRRHKSLHLASEELSDSTPSSLAQESRTLSPIDCSEPTTFYAILHLKNFNHITIPLIISNVNPDNYPNINLEYPNIELIPTTEPNTFTLL